MLFQFVVPQELSWMEMSHHPQEKLTFFFQLSSTAHLSSSVGSVLLDESLKGFRRIGLSSDTDWPHNQNLTASRNFGL